MRVLVAGATGVIGRRLVPLLTAIGHDVTALARSPRPGAGVVVADALDRAALDRAVRHAAPDAVVNLLTANPRDPDPKRLARDFALTNRLRTEGTRNLLDAAAAAGTRRVVCEGLAYAYQPADDLADEDAPLWTEHPPRQLAPVVAALVELERRTAAAHGLVLRFGHLYGPGTAYAADGAVTARVRAGTMPLVGGGNAVFSFTHADDAASAIAASLEKEHVTGALNVVDDQPAAVHVWLPALARMLGVPAPRRVPAALARLLIGGWGVAYLNELRGADNARARLWLDWRPRYASWTEGLAELADADIPRGERPRGERPRGERPRGERPRAERPRAERPLGERPLGERTDG